MQEIKTECIKLIQCTESQTKQAEVPSFVKKDATAIAQRFHQSLPEYKETPLVRLNALAKSLNIQALFVKDESKRFGLDAFKGLGGIYALARVICKELNLYIDEFSFEKLKDPEYVERIQSMVFVTATDGNHGKGVAWAANQLGCVAHIYLPSGSSEHRAQAIRSVNPKAEVCIMDTDYDDTVRYASRMAQENNWYLIQDTSWEGYTEVPIWIIQGYTTMVYETCKRLERGKIVPTHVFVQAGVGAMAGGVIGYLSDYYSECKPRFIVVEPEGNACIYQSVKAGDGRPHKAENQFHTIMAGLNCGEPCTLTWPILRDFVEDYIKCSDEVSEYGMRCLANPLSGDPSIISGESGAVTVGVVSLLASRKEFKEMRKLLNLNENSVVLCFSTEGDTDPDHYQRILKKEKINLER